MLLFQNLPMATKVKDNGDEVSVACTWHCGNSEIQ